MKFTLIPALVFVLCCVCSCAEDQPENKIHGNSCSENGSQELKGSWLLTESGHSPGSGYITTAVSSTPPQEISFHADGTLETTIEILKDFKFYSLQIDAIYGEEFVTFYKEHAGEDLAPSYNFCIDGNQKFLILYYRWCIEGCHMGFKAIE